MKKYQVKPIIYGHIIYQKKKEEIILGCEILYSNSPPPTDFSFLINLYRNPQETAKSITFETDSAYTQNRCSSHLAHMVNFIWPFWSGKKEGSKEIIGTSWDAKFQKPKEQVLHCPVVHSNSPCWLVSLYFLFQLSIPLKIIWNAQAMYKMSQRDITSLRSSLWRRHSDLLLHQVLEVSR